MVVFRKADVLRFHNLFDVGENVFFIAADNVENEFFAQNLISKTFAILRAGFGDVADDKRP